MIHWVYILRCVNDRYYTGYTIDLLRRYREHQAGSPKCKYTRSFKPVHMVYCWPLEDKATALRLEKAIKRLTRPDKEKWLTQAEDILQLLNTP
jgi:putative endonuclease